MLKPVTKFACSNADVLFCDTSLSSSIGFVIWDLSSFTPEKNVTGQISNYIGY